MLAIIANKLSPPSWKILSTPKSCTLIMIVWPLKVSLWGRGGEGRGWERGRKGIEAEGRGRERMGKREEGDWSRGKGKEGGRGSKQREGERGRKGIEAEGRGRRGGICIPALSRTRGYSAAYTPQCTRVMGVTVSASQVSRTEVALMSLSVTLSLDTHFPGTRSSFEHTGSQFCCRNMVNE